MSVSITEASPRGVARAECPACGSGHARPVGGAAPGFEVVAGGMTFRHPSYTVQHCANCLLYYKDNCFAVEWLDKYYDELEFESFESASLFPTDRILVDFLRQFPRGSRLLDFGCGVGRILAEVVGQYECHGVEVNERAKEMARGRGICIHSEERLLSGEKARFDAILLTDVYEHLASPIDTLQRLVSLLRQQGQLLIVTGNGDAVRDREFMGEFWYFRALGHLQMPGRDHLRWLSRRLGMELTQLAEVSHYDTPLAARFRQQMQTWAYRQFRLGPGSPLTAILRMVPALNRAKDWTVAPALTCTTDHIVAVFTKLDSSPEGKSG